MNIPNNRFTRNTYVRKGAKLLFNLGVRAVKKVAPGVAVMTCAFYINHDLNKPATTQPKLPKQYDAAWAYEAGKQHIKDSLKIVELEQRVAADSMKIYHLTQKIKK